MENEYSLGNSVPDLAGRKCAVIVAHPDDETLWAGGLILMNPGAEWDIITLCRGSDADRAPKFKKALAVYHAAGAMGDLDDGPQQRPLNPAEVENTILDLLGERAYDLIITHSPEGEYTRHRRHEETGRAVLGLIETNRLKTSEIWLFAYTDDNRREFPKLIAAADVQLELPQGVWQKKYEIITNVYEFGPASWEAQTTPKTEGFWRFTSVEGVEETIRKKSGVQ